MAVCAPPDVFLCEAGGRALDMIYEEKGAGAEC